MVVRVLRACWFVSELMRLLSRLGLRRCSGAWFLGGTVSFLWGVWVIDQVRSGLLRMAIESSTLEDIDID